MYPMHLIFCLLIELKNPARGVFNVRGHHPNGSPGYEKSTRLIGLCGYF
jgi:hypothetical protein